MVYEVFVLQVWSAYISNDKNIFPLKLSQHFVTIFDLKNFKIK